MSAYQYNLNGLIGFVVVTGGWGLVLLLITRRWFPWPGRRSRAMRETGNK